jgi:hypothetical protein
LVYAVVPNPKLLGWLDSYARSNAEVPASDDFTCDFAKAPIPTPETAPTLPLCAYGLSKRTAEHYADWFRRMRGLDIINIALWKRVWTAPGPRTVTQALWPSSADAFLPAYGACLRERSPNS